MKKTAISKMLEKYEQHIINHAELGKLAWSDEDKAVFKVEQELYAMFAKHLRMILPVERQQIEAAYWEGNKFGKLQTKEEYYLKTFNQPTDEL